MAFLDFTKITDQISAELLVVILAALSLLAFTIAITLSFKWFRATLSDKRTSPLQDPLITRLRQLNLQNSGFDGHGRISFSNDEWNQTMEGVKYLPKEEQHSAYTYISEHIPKEHPFYESAKTLSKFG